MQFWRIANLSAPHNRAPTWGFPPLEGSFPFDQSRAISELLGEFTSTPNRCYYCIWEGNGYIDGSLYSSARVRVPHRDYLLFSGHIDTVMSFPPEFLWGLLPNIWWPEDRAWCVATEIDLESTYIGGTDECIERILNCPDLEALPTQLEARVDSGGDTINL